MRILLIALLSFQIVSAAEFPEWITVTGECNKSIEPDRVSVQLSVEVLKNKVKNSAEEANKRYNKILAAFKDLKLENAEYETTEYRTYPQKVWEKDKQVFKGYITRIGLKVSTSEMNKAGKLLGVGNDLDVDSVSGPESYVSKEKIKKTYRECLKVATQDATEKAEILAKSLKVNLGKTKSIVEGKNDISPPTPFPRAMHFKGAAEMAADAPNIEYGKQDVRVDLTVSFGIN